ncbi:hypothetical protein [Paenisporosarcina cavernae]|uniref:RNA polymerase sigma-70 region 4 domain-containing protein n=1 Tax=Paenisporosarcina cavernae TaxID=2320858 RepID=A0A385YTL6_9BACL|nr:hypothetical protein [Paenisporosarcina cavernae]AYC29652.1 hypothetical protein D3873_07025 [Paenisporosarcina cavernae]AYC30016.1 hypothetical protein D3873_09080 [Paenisporosarcina cavernae]
MKMLANYLDLCATLETIELDLERVNADMDYWFGKGSYMLGSIGATKFGSKEAIERVDLFHNRKHEIMQRKEHYEVMKKDYERALGKLNRIEYAIMKKVVVDRKSLKEISDELNLSYGYVRNVSAKCDKILHTYLTNSVLLYK